MKLLLPIFALFALMAVPETEKSCNERSSGQYGKPLIAFGLIADVQYCDCEPAGSRFYRNSTHKLREALQSLKKDSAEFIINLGDLIDHGFHSFKPVLELIDSAGIKVYHCAGNHDYSVESKHKRKLPIDLHGRKGYYSFINRDFRFIVLNGNDMSLYSSNRRSSFREAESYLKSLMDAGGINAVNWNGGIGSGQIRWLADQLDDAAAGGQKVLIFCHFPLFPENIHNLLNYKEVVPVLEKYNNIIAWFNGHNHAGNYGNLNRIHFITMKGMVETESEGSCGLIEVFSNKICITGYGREKSQVLAY